MNKSKQVVFTAFLAALGVILPQMFHIFGPVGGKVLLPMHIPAILAGLICGPLSGFIVGFVSVILSYLFTGMPPMPMLVFMIVELPIYGLVSGILYNKVKANVVVSLIGAMIAGRTCVGIMLFVATKLIGITLPPFMNIIGMIVTGLPGIVLQLAVIPLTIVILKKVGLKNASV